MFCGEEQEGKDVGGRGEEGCRGVEGKDVGGRGVNRGWRVGGLEWGLVSREGGGGMRWSMRGKDHALMMEILETSA